MYKENHENILVYDVSYKTSMGAKSMRFRLDKIDRFNKVHIRITYLVLFDYGWCDEIYNNIKYLVSEKSGITYSINNNFA